jgi:hypothetical protein
VRLGRKSVSYAVEVVDNRGGNHWSSPDECRSCGVLAVDRSEYKMERAVAHKKLEDCMGGMVDRTFEIRSSSIAGCPTSKLEGQRLTF